MEDDDDKVVHHDGIEEEHASDDTSDDGMSFRNDDDSSSSSSSTRISYQSSHSSGSHESIHDDEEEEDYRNEEEEEDHAVPFSSNFDSILSRQQEDDDEQDTAHHHHEDNEHKGTNESHEEQPQLADIPKLFLGGTPIVSSSSFHDEIALDDSSPPTDNTIFSTSKDENDMPNEKKGLNIPPQQDNQNDQAAREVKNIMVDDDDLSGVNDSVSLSNHDPVNDDNNNNINKPLPPLTPTPSHDVIQTRQKDKNASQSNDSLPQQPSSVSAPPNKEWPDEFLPPSSPSVKVDDDDNHDSMHDSSHESSRRDEWPDEFLPPVDKDDNGNDDKDDVDSIPGERRPPSTSHIDQEQTLHQSTDNTKTQEEETTLLQSPSKKNESGGDLYVLVLITSRPTGDRQVVRHQRDALTIMDDLDIAYVTCDGADVAQRKQRDDLLDLSGLSSDVYPQFFLVWGNGAITFYGDIHDFYDANDAGTLVSDFGGRVSEDHSDNNGLGEKNTATTAITSSSNNGEPFRSKTMNTTAETAKFGKKHQGKEPPKKSAVGEQSILFDFVEPWLDEVEREDRYQTNTVKRNSVPRGSNQNAPIYGHQHDKGRQPEAFLDEEQGFVDWMPKRLGYQDDDLRDDLDDDLEHLSAKSSAANHGPSCWTHYIIPLFVGQVVGVLIGWILWIR